MHDDTIASLIDSTTTAMGSLFKEAFVHRKNMERLEAEKEKEIELARVRNQVEDEHSPEAVADTLEESSEPPTRQETEAAIDELVDAEMCAVCQDLLSGLKERSAREQIIGIMEYGEFKRELSEDAGIDELKALISDTDVLHSVLEENLRAPP